jgi:hypothetical protein
MRRQKKKKNTMQEEDNKGLDVTCKGDFYLISLEVRCYFQDFCRFHTRHSSVVVWLLWHSSAVSDVSQTAVSFGERLVVCGWQRRALLARVLP